MNGPPSIPSSLHPGNSQSLQQSPATPLSSANSRSMVVESRSHLYSKAIEGHAKWLPVLVRPLPQSIVPPSPVLARVLRSSLKNFRFLGHDWSSSRVRCPSSRTYSPFRRPRRSRAHARLLVDCRRMRDEPHIEGWVRGLGSGGLYCTHNPPLVESLRAKNSGVVVGVHSAVLMHRQRYPRTINRRVSVNVRMGKVRH